MRVIIVGPNLIDQSKGQFHVHKEGCSHLRRAEYKYRQDLKYPIELSSVKAVVAYVYPADEFDYDPTDESNYNNYVQDFWFAPCTKELPDE